MTSVESPVDVAVPVAMDKQTVTDGPLKNRAEDGKSRKSNNFRRIPRQIPAMSKDNHFKGQNVRSKGGRRKTMSESSEVVQSSQRVNRRRRTTSEISSKGAVVDQSAMKKLRDTIAEKHHREGLNLVNSYMKNRLELARYENTKIFLQRCSSYKLVPSKYRLQNDRLRNTKNVIMTLDRFSYQIMRADLRYNRKRCSQVQKLLADKMNRMQELFGEELMEDVSNVSNESYEKRFLRVKDQNQKTFDKLVKEYQLKESEIQESEKEFALALEREKEREDRRKLQSESKSAEKAVQQSEQESPKQEEPTE